jgi:hypothetical protein
MSTESTPEQSLGKALLLNGEAMAALAEMQAEPDDWNRLVGLALAEHTLGRHAASDSALHALIAQYRRDWAIDIAMVYAWRLEGNRAFEWLDRAVADQDWTAWMINEPMFAPLHDDPRWVPLLRKHGMAPEQLAAIKFDVKVPRI